MVKYDDANQNEILVKFIGSVVLCTLEANVTWERIRIDSPVYLSTPIAFGVEKHKRFYLTIQRATPFYKLQLADNISDLKHNACMTNEKEVIMKVQARDEGKDLYRALKNLFIAVEEQVKAAELKIRSREELEVENLLKSF